MNKFRVLIAIAMVFTLLSSLMLVPVFADTAEVADTAEAVEHDHDGDGVADHDADAHDTTAATTVDDGWTTLGTSDFIALIVAAVILVAFVVAIVLFVPKKTKQR